MDCISMSPNNSMSTYNSSAPDALASIEVMIEQERRIYRTEDYFSQSGPQQFGINAECRSKMSEWCFQVVDYCKFSRDTVAIAMSYVDRFLMTPFGSDALESRKLFQLVVMSSLYTAIKIHEPEAMEPRVIAKLSSGMYTEDEVTKMERTILEALQWRMNPPTALSFVHQFLRLIPKNILSDYEKAEAFEICKVQIEMSIHAYAFVGVNASTIAFAALSNAFDLINSQNILKYNSLKEIEMTTCLHFSGFDLSEIQCMLLDLVQLSINEERLIAPLSTSKTKNDESELHCRGKYSIHTSPKCVSATK